MKHSMRERKVDIDSRSRDRGTSWALHQGFFWESIQEILRKHLRGFFYFWRFEIEFFCIWKLSFNDKNECKI